MALATLRFLTVLSRSGGLPAVAMGMLLVVASWHGPNALPAAAATPRVIAMDDSGFTPPSLEVHEGDIVVFENRGAASRWPASHIHPTHLIYPEFDPRRPIGPGERWSFRFSRPGTWKFHDHLTPDMTGTILVQPHRETKSPGVGRSVVSWLMVPW